MLWLNKVLPRLNFCYGLVEKASTAVAATIIFALMLLVVADVAGRKFFNSPVHGTIEIASLTLPVIVFLSIAYLQGLKEHVTVDLFTSRLPQQVQLSMDVFAIGPRRGSDGDRYLENKCVRLEFLGRPGVLHGDCRDPDLARARSRCVRQRAIEYSTAFRLCRWVRNAGLTVAPKQLITAVRGDE